MRGGIQNVLTVGRLVQLVSSSKSIQIELPYQILHMFDEHHIQKVEICQKDTYAAWKEKDGCGACMALGYDSLCCVHLCVFESPWVSSLVEKWVLNVLKDFLFIYLESPCPISITIFSAATVSRVYEVSQTLCLWLVFVSSLLIGQQQNEGLAAGIVV